MREITGKDDVSYWKCKMNEPNSCVSSIVSTLQFILPPKYIGRIGEGVREVLNMDLRQYSKTLNGILVAYEKVKMNTKYAEIIGDHAFLPLSITATFLVFAPTIGCILKGVVNKLSMTHIGCLVHNSFNASIAMPRDQYGNVDFVGMNIAINEEIIFEVIGMDLASKIIFFKGRLIRTSCSEEQAEIEIEPQTLENADAKLSLEERDSSSGYHTATGSTSDPGIDSPRKRKRKMQTVDVDSRELADELVNEEEVESKQEREDEVSKKRKKKKKKEKHKFEENVTDFPEENVKRKKKKKKDLEKEDKDEDEEILSDLHSYIGVGEEGSEVKDKTRKRKRVDIDVSDVSRVKKSKKSRTSAEEIGYEEKERKSKKKTLTKVNNETVVSEEMCELSWSGEQEQVKKKKKKKKDRK